MDIKSIQIVLKKRGLYNGRIDGIAGRLTYAAVIGGLGAMVPGVPWETWSAPRRQVAFMQAHFKSLEIETGPIDGLAGPQTLYAFEIFQHLELTGEAPELWRDKVAPDPEPEGPQTWPDYSGIEKFFGARGENQTMLIPPYPMWIAWDLETPVKRFSIHEKCHDSALRVLQKVRDHYSPEQILMHGFDIFGGCLNVRKMRGGSSWSTHSWGIAIDWDPIRNQYKWGRDRAYLDDPGCDQFWEFWEGEGWISLGRVRSFDFMHVQATRL